MTVSPTARHIRVKSANLQLFEAAADLTAAELKQRTGCVRLEDIAGVRLQMQRERHQRRQERRRVRQEELATLVATVVEGTALAGESVQPAVELEPEPVQEQINLEPAVEPEPAADEPLSDPCSICLEPMNLEDAADPLWKNLLEGSECVHMLHVGCATKWKEKQQSMGHEPCCPTCRRPMD